MGRTLKSPGRRFYRRNAESLARALLGRYLVRRWRGGELVGRIVEVEAYLGPEDRAAHSYAGRHTRRNHSMYLDAGHAYVYFIYGMHHCFNVVAGRAGDPAACLIRAVEPIEGIEAMRRHRAGSRRPADLKTTDLCSGPAKLAEAFRIDRSFDGVDLTGDGPIRIAGSRSVTSGSVRAAPRIGVDYAGPWARRPLRFCLAGSKHLSVRP